MPTISTPTLNVAGPLTATKINALYVDEGANSATNESNTAVGVDVLRNVVANVGTDSQYNTGVGKHALQALTTASDCTAVGAQALRDCTTGYYNTAVGHYAAGLTTTGWRNCAFGTFALNDQLTGNENSAFGFQCMHSNIDGNYNVAMGRQAAYNATSPEYATALGYKALLALTIGDYDVAVGALCLQDLTTGELNVGVGHATGTGITTGSGNTILGANIGGLTSSLENNIILASGSTIRGQFDGTNWTWQGNANIAGDCIGLGGTFSPDVGLYVISDGLTTTDQFGAIIDPLASSAATASGTGLKARLRTAVAAFTMTNARTIHIADAVVGAGSTITNLYGLYIDAISAGGTLNYAIYTNAGLVRFGGAVTCASTLVATSTATASAFHVGSNQVVGAQGAAVADATDAASAITQLNALLARARAHGLIAT